MAYIPQPVLFSWKEVACYPQIDILRMFHDSPRTVLGQEK